MSDFRKSIYSLFFIMESGGKHDKGCNKRRTGC